MKLSFTNLSGLIIFCFMTTNHNVMAGARNCLQSYSPDQTFMSNQTSLKSALDSVKKAKTSADYGEALNSLILELNPDEQLVRLGLNNFNAARTKEESQAVSEKKQLLEKHLKNAMPPEVAELSLKRLAKENILLGPIHEILFRYAIGFKNRSSNANFGLKKELVKFKSSMTSSAPGDIAYRENKASQMYSELMELFSFFSRFGDFKQLSQVKKLDLVSGYQEHTKFMHSIFNYKVKNETLIKNIELLLEIHALPGSKEFFEKAFLTSMEAIYKTCYRRAYGPFETGMEFAKYAVLPGTLTLLSLQGYDHNLIGFASVFTAFASLGTLIYDGARGFNESAIPTFKSAPKSLWIKASNFFSKKKIEKQLGSDLGESAINEAAEVIKLSAPVADKLDFDFGNIKRELANGIQKDIHLPNWGKEFSSGVSNLMTRLTLIRDELVQINAKVDPIFNEIQQAKLERTTYQRQATETLNELYGDKLFALLIDHQAIELDLITLSHALDQYIIGLEQYAKSSEHTPAQQYFIKSKAEALQNQLLTLKNFAKPLTDYKVNITTILDTLNMTTTSVQLSEIQNLNLKIVR